MQPSRITFFEMRYYFCAQNQIGYVIPKHFYTQSTNYLFMLSQEAIIALIFGFIIAWFVEKHYIGRTGVLPNVAIIFVILCPYLRITPPIVKLWMIVGLILGSISLIFLLKKATLPSLIYRITYPFYSGKTVIGLYAPYELFKWLLPSYLFSTLFWLTTLVFIILIWYIGITYFNNDLPFKGN